MVWWLKLETPHLHPQSQAFEHLVPLFGGTCWKRWATGSGLWEFKDTSHFSFHSLHSALGWDTVPDTNAYPLLPHFPAMRDACTPGNVSPDTLFLLLVAFGLCWLSQTQCRNENRDRYQRVGSSSDSPKHAVYGRTMEVIGWKQVWVSVMSLQQKPS